MIFYHPGQAVFCLCGGAPGCAASLSSAARFGRAMFASRRLKYRDYSAPSFYFVTVCSDFKRCTFGKVVDNKMEFSPLGRIVEEAWLALSSRIFGIQLHAQVVMPNHIHGIVEIFPLKLSPPTAPLQRATGASAEGRTTVSLRQKIRPTPSLSIIVRSFKADVTRQAGVELEWKKEIWQRNYFDRVIRDGPEFAHASRYIAENPTRWQTQGQRMRAEREAKRAQQAAPLQRGRA
jgi:REP element-mobilizing transposase RayT